MFKSTEEKILKDGLKPLKKLNFKCKRYSVSKSEVSGSFYTVVYESAKSKRAVTVSYFPDFYHASASIRNLDNYFDFSDSGALRIKELALNQFSGEPIDKLKKYLRVLIGILTTQYIDVLNGEKFENDRFDWSLYK